MSNTLGQKELKHSWPLETGITEDAKHEGRVSNLIAEGNYGVKTNVSLRKKMGL